MFTVFSFSSHFGFFRNNEKVQSEYSLRADSKDDIPTDSRLEAAKNGSEDLGLVNLSFAYGGICLQLRAVREVCPPICRESGRTGEV